MGIEHDLLGAKPSVRECLIYYRKLGSCFIDPPKVRLSLASKTVSGEEEVGVRDVVISTAIQCYAPGKARMKPRVSEGEQAIAESTLRAGHHTTRQHVHHTWHISGVSRAVTHDIFHSHPFYNTEQQSQRYVLAREGSYLVPTGLSEEQRQVYLGVAEYANRAYFQLLDLLAPEVERRVREMYPTNGWNVPATAERLSKKAGKISQEIARYVLPVAQKTTFYHTLSELQLLRLFRASQMAHVTDEARYVVGQMIEEVAKVDPQILEELEDPWPLEEEPVLEENYIADSKREFDLALRGGNSRLTVSPEGDRHFLANQIRVIRGVPISQLSDEEALLLLMDPANNGFLADVYEVGMMDPLTNALRQVSLRFMTKLSHTADSQRQRHRMTPGATPSLETLYDGRPDYITPMIIRESRELSGAYSEVMGNIYDGVRRAIECGVARGYALYLLPNAQAVRVSEAGSLFDWIHRWKQRLCYLAQEEIFFISTEQVEQVLKHFPEAERLFLAPCGVRQAAGVRPRCPEGDRWCGRPVYRWQIAQYREGRLV